MICCLFSYLVQCFNFLKYLWKLSLKCTVSVFLFFYIILFSRWKHFETLNSHGVLLPVFSVYCEPDQEGGWGWEWGGVIIQRGSPLPWRLVSSHWLEPRNHWNCEWMSILYSVTIQLCNSINRSSCFSF